MTGTPVSTMAGRIALAALVLSVAVGTPAFGQTPVTTCGQEVSGHAVLNAALDCTGFDGYAVHMHAGVLTMNGFTITGGTTGVFCDGPCKILGPGTITGSELFGVSAFETKTTIRNVDITNHGAFGIQSWRKAVVEGPATISGNGIGIRTGAGLTVRNMTITGNAAAVHGANNAGTATANIIDSTITGNGEGVAAQKAVRVTRSSITGNGTFGVTADQTLSVSVGDGCRRGRTVVTLKDTTVTGNDTDPDCGVTELCADVATCDKPPRLSGTSTCERSHMNSTGFPGGDWDVCTLD
jgi:hypothetical protein